jgi:hypothetical protein
MLKTAEQLSEILKDLDGPCRFTDDHLWRWANENKRGVIGWRYDLESAPPYTSSLDAALSLLPVCGLEGAIDERADYVIHHVNGGLTIFASVAPNTGLENSSFGANVAIALCRAVMDADPHHQRS